MKRRRGVALVTAVFFALICGLIGRVLYTRGPLALALSFRGDLSLQAQHAAESGLALALNQLARNPAWKGETLALAPDGQIACVADQGNVFGLLKDEQGRKTQFLIRFNYQDGAGGGDGMPDPSGSHFLSSPLPSVNNGLATGNATAPWPGNATSVPAGTVAILVQGRAGPALPNLLRPDDPVLASGLTSETLHYEFVLAPDWGGPEASLMAGGDIKLTSSGTVEVGVVGPAVRPRLRSKRGIQVVDPVGDAIPLNMEGGELGFDPAAGLVATPDPGIVHRVEQVGDNQDMFKITWADVPKPDPATSSQLPGGVYVTEPDGTLSYFPCDLAGFRANPAQPSIPTVLPAGVTYVNGTWSMTQPVTVSPSVSGTKSLSIGTRSALQNWNPSQPGNFSSAQEATTSSPVCSLNLNRALLYAREDVQILANVRARQAGIISEGDLVVGASSVEFSVSSSNSTSGNTTTTTQTATPIRTGTQTLAMYVKKDLHLTTHQLQTSTTTSSGGNTTTTTHEHYGDLTLEGLIYAWGNVDVDSNDKDVSLAGALVAYGADPGAGKPGTASSSRGNLNISSKNLKLIYDTAKLHNPALNPIATGRPFRCERRFFSTR